MVADTGIPAGYKQTEVGVIPEDWDVQNFGQLVYYTKGFAFKSKDYCSNGVRIIRVSDTTYDSIKETNAIYISEDETHKYKKWRLNEDDLIFSTVGSKPPMYDSLVGKAIIINKKYDGCLLNQNAVLIRAKQKTKYKQQILLNHFKTKRYVQYIESIYRGNANQASITLEDLFKYPIPLPKLDSELFAIATVLSDTDALIDHLEKLIAKKKNIKQGAMQQLLTGKKRLLGFGGEWNISTLKNLSDYITVGFVGSMSHLFTTGGVPLLRGTNIQPGFLNLTELKYISNQTHSLWKKSSLEPSDIIVVRVGYPGTATVIPEGMGALNSASLVIIRPKRDKVNSNYICYVLNSNWGKREVQNQLVGGAQQVFNIKTASEFKISIPPTKSEQSAIATILSDMDSEIESLEQKRDKYTMIKQGMMQELLTGKTRLV